MWLMLFKDCYMQGITVIRSKRGGDTQVSDHCEWLLTVPDKPDAIRFSFIPITSLLKNTPGRGFLSHAINLYLRCKLIFIFFSTKVESTILKKEKSNKVEVYSSHDSLDKLAIIIYMLFGLSIVKLCDILGFAFMKKLILLTWDIKANH